MALNNTYIAKKKSLKEVLDNAEGVEEMMSQFIEDHPDYSFSLVIRKDELEDEWIIELNIKSNEEQMDKEVS